MQSDMLIKKLLKVAAICEASFFAIIFSAFILSGPLMSLLGGGREAVGFVSGFSAFLPDLANVVIHTAAYFGVWYLFNRSADPQKYSGSNGIFLISYVVLGNVVNILSNLAFNRFVLQPTDIYNISVLISYRSYTTSLIGFLHSAAVVLLWIIFGMEWYRNSLIREQMMNQQINNNKT